MAGIAGLYTAINAIIREKESQGKGAIHTEQVISEVKKEVDIHSATLDWYVDGAISDAVGSCLWQAGYRAVEKGTGLFVNPDRIKRPEYLSKLFNNAHLSAQQKQQVVDMMAKKIQDSGVSGQMSFDFENNMFIEDITTDQLIQMLMEDAYKEA